MAVRMRAVGAAGVVAAGVVAAALVAQLPAIGLEPHVAIATPSSAGQRLVCPGATIAAGAAGTKASDLSAAASPARVTGTSGAARTATIALARGGVLGARSTAPRLVTAPAATGSTGAIAAAQSQSGADGDVAGLAATGCTVPANAAWLVAGSTSTGRTTVLSLANASGVPAQVAVRVWTEHGAAAEPTQVTVSPRSREAVSLSGIATNAAATAVEVTSTGGQVAAALEQRTVRGLESGGLDVTGPTVAPTTTQSIPGVRIIGSAAVAAASGGTDAADLVPVVRLLAPGRTGGDVVLRLTSADGGAARTLTERLAAHTVTDVPLASIGDGVYSVAVTSAVPVVAAARVSVVNDPSGSTTDTSATGSTETAGGIGTNGTGTSTSTARGIDLAWIAAAEPLGASAAAAVAEGPSPQLVLANPTGTAVRVRVAPKGGSATTVSVPAHGAAKTDVASGMLVLTGTAGLTAAVAYSGGAGVAGYPVAPADQAAHPVRVTH